MSEYSLEVPFWIDTDGYTDRDREMFVSGYEFAVIVAACIKRAEIRRPIHRENESRVRMFCGRLGLRCTITPHDGYEGCETWSDLVVG